MIHATARSREGDSLFDLIAGLREDVRNLFHEEVQLAKTEISEKISLLSRNSICLGIGGIVALLGLTLLLASLSFLLSYALQAVGLSTGISLFLGFLGIAIVSGSVGAILVLKALSAFKKESLVPEKTIQTLKEIKDGGLEQIPIKRYPPAPAPVDTRTSEQIRSDVEQTRGRINREVRGIRTRLKLATLATGVVTHVSHHPVRSVGVGLGTGVAGFLLMRMARLLGRRRHA
jgi:hypothetical protein